MAQSVVPNILTLVLNQRIIATFGSDVNGVLSTAAQVINFLAFFEAGFTLSITVVLYSPYLEKDTRKITSVLHTARVLYQKIGVLVATTGVAISLFMPFIISSSLSSSLISLIFLISVLNISLTFIFSMKYSIMFSVSQQEYKLNLVSLVFQSLSQFLCIVLIQKAVNIVVIRFVWYLIPFLSLPLIAYLFKNNFQGIGFKSEQPSKAGLAGAKDVFTQKIAVLVTNNTALLIISVFLGTRYSSVYSVYYFVYTGLKQVLFSFVMAPFNAFGQLYAGNQTEKLRSTFKTYQFFCIMLIGIILTTANILIISFVRLYTLGILDVDYLDYPFALLFSIAALVEIISYMMGTIVNSAGFFREMKPIALLGAFINLLSSIVLVQFLGLKGIALSAILSYLYMNARIVVLLYRDILRTSSGYFIKYLIGNIVVSVLLSIIASHVPMIISSYYSFGAYSLGVMVIVSAVFITLNYIFDLKEGINCLDLIKTLLVQR